MPRRIRPHDQLGQNITSMSTDNQYSNPVTDLSEFGGSWDPSAPEYHGPDQGYIYPGRRVAHLPGFSWPSTPETCAAGRFDTVWVLDGQLLLCRGCGLDAT